MRRSPGWYPGCLVSVRNLRFWLACVAGWVGLALVESTSVHFDLLRDGRASELGPRLLDRLAADWVWVPVAALVFRTTGRILASGGDGRRLAKRLAALGIGLAPLYMLMDGLTHPLLHGGGGAAVVARLRLIPASTLLWDAFLYSALGIGAYALLLRRRSLDQARESSALRARLERAELELLRAQLEPHFLFNALNTVAGLVRGARPEEATSALARLSELLRYVLEASRQERVPVAWELQFVASYLELQQARFGDRMQFQIHQDAGVRGREVPPLLLQPLIENAVVHGVASTREAARIDVRIGAADGQLRLDVESTRDPAAPQAEVRGGVGLRNTRERLERIYGGDFRFEAGPDGDDRYRVHIALPEAAP